QLEADVAAAHHQKPLGNLLKGEDFRRGEDPLSVKGQAGKLGGTGTGGDDAVLELIGLAVLFRGDADRVRTGEVGFPFDHVHLVPLQQGGHAAGQLFHHAVLPLHQFGQIDGDVPVYTNAHAGRILQLLNPV